MSKIIGDEPCPQCRSRGGDKTGNHLICFEDGGKYCNRCGYKETGYNRDDRIMNKLTVADVKKLPSVDLPDRKLLAKYVDAAGIKVTYSEETGEIDAHYYPRHKNGELTGYQVRGLPKNFKTPGPVGDTKGADLVGKERYGAGGKMLVITEGDLDYVSALQIFGEAGKNYRVVSLPTGANVSAVKRNLEWVESFESVILCLDQDKDGKETASEISELLAPGKVKIMTFGEKDANDMLKNGKSKEFIASLWNANIKRPDGIVSGGETWERLINRPKVKSVPYPDGWDDLNQKTYGIRVGELDTWTSGSGMGKTQVIRELQYHLFQKTEENIGVIALEEPLEDSVEAIMALDLNKRIHLPDVAEKLSDEERYESWLRTVGTNRFHFYDHFGSVDDDSLISKIRYLAKGLGCKYIFLDHLSIVVSEFASEGGERERIDSVMSRLKKLTQELDIWIGLVVHLRKTGTGGKSFEEGAIPSSDDLRGSGSIKQLSNSVYALSRNQQSFDETERNTSLITVLKCRFTGRTGNSDKLFFDDQTGRMIPAQEEEVPISDGKDKF